MDNELIWKKILSIYIKCKVESFPIECHQILSDHNFRVFTYGELQKHNYELYNLCRSYSADAFIHRNFRIAAYNEKVSFLRIRFSLMHELGHIILNTNDEDEADYFASCILAPKILIHKFKCRTSDQIHDTFGLSFAASNRALADYKKWCYAKKGVNETRLAELFFPPEPDDVENNTKVISNPSDRKTNKSSKKWKELEKKRAFLELHDPDCFFRKAEHIWLYGNDL